MKEIENSGFGKGRRMINKDWVDQNEVGFTLVKLKIHQRAQSSMG